MAVLKPSAVGFPGAPPFPNIAIPGTLLGLIGHIVYAIPVALASGDQSYLSSKNEEDVDDGVGKSLTRFRTYHRHNHS